MVENPGVGFHIAIRSEMFHTEVILLYVSYRVSSEKKSQDISFATLYLLKDNNNGHSLVTSG